jgi:hypothetical protein
MKRPALALLPLALLIACNKPTAYRAYSDEKVAVGVMRKPAVAAAAPEAGDVAAPEAGAAGNTPLPAGAPMLAYSYEADLSVPDGRVPSLLARHQQACAGAGASLCQVLGSNVTTDRGATTAELQLRAEPLWLARFRSGLVQDAKGAGGSLTRSSVESEDLTRSMVDTEAALRAKTTLRDRLQKLLAEHPGKMSDLLEIEKQLADTQGEIDAAQSELAVMRGRIAMSAMSLHYGSRAADMGSRPHPLTDALANFGTVMATAAGVIVYLVAFLIPFSVIIVPLVWLLLRWRRSRMKAKAKTGA